MLPGLIQLQRLDSATRPSPFGRIICIRVLGDREYIIFSTLSPRATPSRLDNSIRHDAFHSASAGSGGGPDCLHHRARQSARCEPPGRIGSTACQEAVQQLWINVSSSGDPDNYKPNDDADDASELAKYFEYSDHDNAAAAAAVDV